jgi:hypothetical protein
LPLRTRVAVRTVVIWRGQCSADARPRFPVPAVRSEPFHGPLGLGVQDGPKSHPSRQPWLWRAWSTAGEVLGLRRAASVRRPRCPRSLRARPRPRRLHSARGIRRAAIGGGDLVELDAERCERADGSATRIAACGVAGEPIGRFSRSWLGLGGLGSDRLVHRLCCCSVFLGLHLVGAENLVTSCDLQILVYQAAEAVSS